MRISAFGLTGVLIAWAFGLYDWSILLIAFCILGYVVDILVWGPLREVEEETKRFEKRR